MLRSAALGALRAVAAGVLVLVVAFGLLLLVASIAGAPPEHDIVPVGTTALQVRVISPLGPRISDSPTDHLQAPISPTSSLATVRCLAWLELNAGECPEAASLAQTYWPQLAQEPQMIYVGLEWPDCLAEPPHFNVERVTNMIQGGVVTLHCHSTGAWFGGGPIGHDVGSPAVQLVLVPTAGISPGLVWVYREDRVERWLEDDARTTLLGVVTIR